MVNVQAIAFTRYVPTNQLNKTRRTMTINTNDKDTQAFLDALEPYPKEVIDLFLTHLVEPSNRATTLKALQRLTELCEQQWIREELDDIFSQIDQLSSRRGKKAVYKIHQLRKRAIGLQAALVSLQTKQPTTTPASKSVGCMNSAQKPEQKH